MSIVVVEFLRKSGMYSEGEVAGFPASVANSMIQRGVAREYVSEQKGKSNKQSSSRRPRLQDQDDAEDKQMESAAGPKRYETK